MIFQQIVNEEQGCLSYLIGCGQSGEAALVDPARDRIDDYVALARKKGVTPHPHRRDPRPRRPRLGQPGARRPHGGADPPASGRRRRVPREPVEDGAEIRLGNVSLRVLHTPGHTPESISLLVTDLSRGAEPWFVLTGDALFVGDVGRPDFGGEQAAARLYGSLTGRLLQLPDSVEVYPAHGAGSSCGRAMSSKTASTIGFERRFNAALQARDEEDFVKALMTGLPAKPPNFERIIARNRALGRAVERPIRVRWGRRRCGRPSTRARASSTCASPPSSAPATSPARSTCGSRARSSRPGRPVPPRRTRRWCSWLAGPPISPAPMQGLSRIGVDDIAGHLQWGMTDWKSHGLPLATVPADLGARAGRACARSGRTWW